MKPSPLEEEEEEEEEDNLRFLLLVVAAAAPAAGAGTPSAVKSVNAFVLPRKLLLRWSSTTAWTDEERRVVVSATTNTANFMIIYGSLRISLANLCVF